MDLDTLATRLCAREAVDVSDFQRRARVLQALWREEQGIACGEHVHRGVGRPLGSRLPMPMAQETLANFLTDRVRDVVRDEVLDRSRSRGKLFGRPRIFNDLLSSQPLCFNLFAELRYDLPLASSWISGLTRGRFAEVLAIDFEHSPARSDARYSADRSAFDVFLTCTTASGGRGFLGIEVKYHENLIGRPAAHRARYDEIADQMGCFADGARARLRSAPLQQIWRDHLLAGVVRQVDGYEDGMFVLLHPEANTHCVRAVQAYAATLTDSGSFAAWTLEHVLDALRGPGGAPWAHAVHARYCDFGKIDRALHGTPAR